MRIALVGNPNSGKTTLFNRLTGANQYVGNWPGVTIDRKIGKLKADKSVELVDLPGIYSLSPYTGEEEIARNYLMKEKPDVIIDIVDGTNLERNLYLTTQLADINIPVVVALNMNDVLKKNGEIIDLKKLEKVFAVPFIPISALTGENIDGLAKAAIQLGKQAEKGEAAQAGGRQIQFSAPLEQAFATISQIAAVETSPLNRWYQLKLFERDPIVQKELQLSKEQLERIDQLVSEIETQEDDEAPCLISAHRYDTIVEDIQHSYQQKSKVSLSLSDRIDRFVTNRILALPIFVLVMFLVYYISVSTIGSMGTDWVNDGLFGDGWFALGIGRSDYEEKLEDFDTAQTYVAAFEEKAVAEELDPQTASELVADASFYDDNGEIEETVAVDFETYQEASAVAEPDPTEYKTWVPSVPVLLDKALSSIHVSTWLHELLLDGIVAGLGAVLGFLPQMFVLFLCLAFLESIGYMARIAVIMDRLFRQFGFSGKSLIPLMIGTGCSIPGIMAARTIENEKDRKMTVITTSFIPCGAKLPVIALIAGAFFGNSGLITTACYFIGLAAVVLSGIILKKTRLFAGETSPFVIELPAYRLPRPQDVLRSAFDRSWAFITKAASVIILTSILLWFLQSYGYQNGLHRVDDVNTSLLANVGSAIGMVFAPLGFGGWKPAVATITGLIAKENIVGTFGVLYGMGEVAENGWQIWQNMAVDFSKVSAFSFLLFNLLCAPCFAAIGAIKREMGNAKWTFFTVGYQTVFAYAVSFMFNQLAGLFTGNYQLFGVITALCVLIVFLFFLFRPANQKQISYKNKQLGKA